MKIFDGMKQPNVRSLAMAGAFFLTTAIGMSGASYAADDCYNVCYEGATCTPSGKSCMYVVSNKINCKTYCSMLSSSDEKKAANPEQVKPTKKAPSGRNGGLNDRIE